MKLRGQLAGVARHHDGSIWVASQGRASKHYFARSTDGGKTFTTHDAGVVGLPRLFGPTSRGVLGAPKSAPWQGLRELRHAPFRPPNRGYPFALAVGQ